ncbi:conjugal transfer protein TraG [Labrys miyagiensis]|uniref:Conjugal transfer protein TraG n=1 Tax=Labrys miyagiensis TaxID=346912 RepID=A0ABQ6CIA4_9HYPH|nr:type IV secretory system conjugative DNA transfer family protein [Labrys miyagiensis]GLS18027.1 conjugal transfer protein TraG [Labrys miyagiensis]
MSRLLIILGLVAGAVVLAAIGVFLGSLWSLNYAVAYYATFRSWAVYTAYAHGDYLLPIRQAEQYGSDARIHHIVGVACLTLAVELGAISLFAIILLFRPFNAKPPAGGARMASRNDLRRAGLLDGIRGKSILLGRIGRQDVRYSGDSHFFVNGPTRTGKGRGFVLTNLLEWDGSAIVLDVKQENWLLTGPARVAMNQKVYLFAPGTAESHRWNPLDFIRPWPERATDLTNLSKTIVPLPAKESQTIWKETAQGLFASVVGYVLDSKTMAGRRHLRSVLRLFTGEDKFSDVLRRILKEEPDLNPFILDGFRLHLAREAEQRLSFEGNIVTPMSPWKNALIAAATSASDFDIRELRRKPFSIFIGVPVSDFGTAEPIIRLMIQQIHDIMLARLPDPVEEPHKVLLMLDEFYQFEQLPEIVKRAPLVAGFGIIIVVIAQGITQIDDRYTAATRKAFLGNMEVRLYIGVGDVETADIVSKEIGNHYVEREGWSKQQGGRSSSSGRFEFVPLRTVAQITGLSDKKTLLYIRSVATAELAKLNFYTDKDFLKRRKAIEARNLTLPEPSLELLGEWPLFEEQPAPHEMERLRPAAAAPGAAGAAQEGLSPDIVSRASAVFRRPDKFFNYARLALAAADHHLVVALLKGLRTNPSVYGELAPSQQRGMFRKAIEPGTAAVQALREAVIAARRAVVDDRARRYATGEILQSVPAVEPIALAASPSIQVGGSAAASPAQSTIVAPDAPTRRAPEGDDAFGGLPVMIEGAAIVARPATLSEDTDTGAMRAALPSGPVPESHRDEEAMNIHEIASSASELSAMESIVDSVSVNMRGDAEGSDTESIQRIRSSIASVRRLIDTGLSDEPRIGSIEPAGALS